MYKKITKNDPEGKLYRIYLQLWDTAGQERYLTVFFHILLCYMELCYCTVYKDHDSVLLGDVRYVYHFQPAVTGVYAAMH